MAWNQPGGTGDKDPWGKRKSSDALDIDKLFASLQNRLRGLFGGTGNSGFGIGLVVGIAIVLWLLGGFYIVQQGERGVVLKFGKKNEITGPGLHWRLPFPVERVEKVNVDQVSTVRIGRHGDKTASLVGADSGYMLTEDENIIVVEFSVQYRVSDANDYLFNMRDPVTTIVQATESAAREIVGKSQLDFVMTAGQLEVADKTRILLQEILDRYKSGIQIVSVQMQKASPPEEVKAAFDDAVKAREDEQRLKNEAEAYSNDVIPRARGAAARLIQEAQGYKASTIARAEGDARRFTQIAGEYVKAPAVTRERLYIETMEHVFSNTTKIFVDQKSGNNLIYLPLDKLIPSTESAASIAGPPTAADSAPAKGASESRSRSDQRSRRVAP